MDHSLLRTWLGLPSGPWPPDHYALIGLSPGVLDPQDVERIVLERMARLRSHQLIHPELVTEGMNRLAQALVCLTDATARAAYDATLGIFATNPPPRVESEVKAQPHPPPLPVALAEAISGFPIATDDGPPPRDATQIIEVPFTPGLAPPETDNPPPYEIVEEGALHLESLPYEVIAEPLAGMTVPGPPRLPWQPRTRRELYSRLASLRRLRSGWAKLKPFMGNPREPLDRPVRVLAFLEGVAEVRSYLGAVPDVIGEPWRSGGIVAALIRQPLLLNAFRVLLPDQRRALALDWRNGDSELEREYNRLRELSRSGRKLRRPFRGRSRVMRAVRWSLRNPETILLGLGIAVLVVAYLRASAGR